ncbi:MAG: hypothetical protein ABIW84_00705 [Ilumatobacteraceae bacterium]
MASSLNDTSRNLMLDQLGTVAVFASLHTGAPGTGGANEATGGSPAYARKAITWSAAAASSKAASNSPVFDVAAGTTVAYVGLWSASTAGTFYGYFDVTDEVYAGQGTYTLTTGTISATG